MYKDLFYYMLSSSICKVRCEVKYCEINVNFQSYSFPLHLHKFRIHFSSWINSPFLFFSHSPIVYCFIVVFVGLVDNENALYLLLLFVIVSIMQIHEQRKWQRFICNSPEEIHIHLLMKIAVIIVDEWWIKINGGYRE